MTRRLSLVLGILLAVGAFVGVLLLGSVLNPSPYHVVVAITEIQPGTILEEGMVGVDAQVVSPQVAGEYVLAEELDRYLGKHVIRGLVPGQPLMHRDLVDADNPAAQRHLALALEDPNLVAMVIPVQEDNAPDGIVPGDHIGIVWSVGEAGFLAGPVGGYEASPAPTYGEGVGPSLPEGVELPPEAAAVLGETTAEPTPEVSLPLAKTIVNTAQVIHVRREREANPAYTGQEGESPYIEGRIVGLEVAVARGEVEAIQFAVANGEYSIVVLSPNADPGRLADGSTLGVMWEDVLAYFQADRLRALGVLTVTGAIRPAGAADIYGAVLAPGTGTESPFSREAPMTGNPTETPTPTTPTGDTDEEGGEVAEATPSPPPAVLPPATPAAVAEVQQPAPGSGGKPGSSTLPVSTSSLLAGFGCVVVVLLVIGGAVALVVRSLRRRRRPQAP